MELEKGKFDIMSVQYGLMNGFRIKGNIFKPEVYIYQVDEPEFGCEGRVEGQKAYAKLFGYTITGPVEWLINEQTLIESGLFDYMWVGTVFLEDGTRELIAYREGTSELNVLSWDKWAEKLPVE